MEQELAEREDGKLEEGELDDDDDDGAAAAAAAVGGDDGDDAGEVNDDDDDDNDARNLTSVQKLLVGGDPLYQKFWIKVTALVQNCRFSIYFRS